MLWTEAETGCYSVGSLQCPASQAPTPSCLPDASDQAAPSLQVQSLQQQLAAAQHEAADMAAEASDLHARLGAQERLEAQMTQAQAQLQAAQHEVQARQVSSQPCLVLVLLWPNTGSPAGQSQGPPIRWAVSCTWRGLPDVSSPAGLGLRLADRLAPRKQHSMRLPAQGRGSLFDSRRGKNPRRASPLWHIVWLTLRGRAVRWPDVAAELGVPGSCRRVLQLLLPQGLAQQHGCQLWGQEAATASCCLQAWRSARTSWNAACALPGGSAFWTLLLGATS